MLVANKANTNMGRTKTSKLGWVSSGALIIVLLLTICSGVLAKYFENRTMPFTMLAGSNAGGLTRSAVARLINERVTSTQVVLTYGGRSQTASMQSLGVTGDIDKTASELFAVGRTATWNPLRSQNIAISLRIDAHVMEKYLTQAFSSQTVLKQPYNARLSLDSTTGSVGITPDTPGVAFNTHAVVAALQAAAGRLRATRITVTMVPVEAPITSKAAQSALPQATRLLDTTYRFLVNNSQVYTASRADILGWLQLVQAHGIVTVAADPQAVRAFIDNTLAARVQASPRDQQISRSDGSILVRGVDGRSITDQATIAAALVKALAAGGPADINVPVQPVVFGTVTVDATCGGNTAGAKLIVVSIGQQHLWACYGTQLVDDTPVTTGAYALTNSNDATPTGVFHVYYHATNTYLTGNDINGSWHDYVYYWMAFYDTRSGMTIGFHDASWQTFPFGGSQYATQGSHGCIHVPLGFMSWLYGWARNGTTVSVHS